MEQILQLILTGGLVAAILGLIGVLLTQYLAGKRHHESLRHTSELEAQRAERERGAELEKQRADALDRYLEQMHRLLTDKQLRPSNKWPEGNAEARESAQAQTAAVLERLDPKRKGHVLRFLYVSALIGTVPSPGEAVVSLRNSNLSKADLTGANLTGADLREANLERVSLSGANLTGANLSKANLLGAELSRAELRGAQLGGADLLGAKLSEANLSRADLRWPNLRDADLSRAQLRRANLQEAKLSGANLRGANLRGANLRDSSVSKHDLAKCQSLEGATMPDGSTHD